MAITFGTAWLNASQIFRYDASAGAYSGNLAGLSVFDYFDDGATVGDILYFGFIGSAADCYRRPFRNLKLHVGTAFAATSVTLEWEYYGSDTLNSFNFNTAANWRPLKVVDTSQGFTQAGERIVHFHAPEYMSEIISGLPAGFAGSRCWISCKITAIDTPTEGGAQSAQLVQMQRPDVSVDSAETLSTIITADQAGTATLLPATASTVGIICLDPMPASLGAIRVDVALSGTTAGAGDTVDINGTDVEGNSITDTLDVSAGDGTYTSALCFKTIDTIDCNGFADGTVSVVQNQWGQIGKREVNSIDIYGYLTIENGGAITDTNKSITQYSSPAVCATIYAHPGGALTLGSLSGGYGRWGCQMSFAKTSWVGDCSNLFVRTGSIIALYASMFHHGKNWLTGTVKDCYFQGGFLCWGAATSVMRTSILAVSLQIQLGATLDGIDLNEQNGSCYMYHNGTILKNSKIPQRIVAATDSVPNAINYSINNTVGSNYWVTHVTSNRHLHEMYTIDLRVVDVSGGGISGAAVAIEDKDGNAVAGSPFTADANGDIVRQTILRRDHFNNGSAIGDTEYLEYSPHTVTISKAGYKTRAIKYTTDRKREEIEMLEVWDATPPVFAGLTSATNCQTSGEVELAWDAATDPGTGVAGYNIYYHTENNAAAIIAQGVRQVASASATGATVGGLTDGTLYYFIVRAYDAECPSNEDMNVVIKSAKPTSALSLGTTTMVSAVESALEASTASLGTTTVATTTKSALKTSAIAIPTLIGRAT